MSSSPNDTSRPTEREEARATTSSAGKWRSARVVRISRPTLPVAPTTATLKPISGTPGLDWDRSWLLTYDADRCFTSGCGLVLRYDGMLRHWQVVPRIER